jgi:hypothetical protein
VFLEKYGAATAVESEEQNRLFREFLAFAADTGLAPSAVAKIGALEGSARSAYFNGLYADMVNAALPPSFQRDEHSTAALLMELQRLGQRQLRQHMQTLRAQFSAIPKSIDERLKTREGAAKIVSMIGEALDKATAALAKK